MKNKKGFTLIELMAVIAILAILIVLAIPNILKIFTSSKEKAFLVQVKELYKAAEQEIINKNISNSSVIIKKFDSNEEDKKINLSGTQNLKYCIKIQDNKITSIAVSNGDYWYFNENIVSLSDISNEDNTKFGAENKRVSCDENGTIVYPTIMLTTDQGSSGLDIGDIVTISKGTISEQFYVIGSNSNETKLFAKYNLYVGNVYSDQGNTLVKRLTSSDPGYGLQNSTATGIAYNATEGASIGTVLFSKKNYWYNATNNKIDTKYGTSYAASNIYDKNYSNTNDWENDSYSISYYVEQYVNRLGINGTGRLLLKSEGTPLNNTNSDIINNGTSYWLGTAATKTGIYAVVNGLAGINFAGIIAEGAFGVRPVIIVPTSDIVIN